MKKNFSAKIVEMYRKNEKLDLLQCAYVVIFAVVTIVAGLIALINQPIGVAFLIVPLICLVTWSMNLIAWSIAKTAIEQFFPEVLENPTKKAIEKTEKTAKTKKTTKVEKTAKTEKAKKK